jgi:Xaa-Pro aminopeptidase
MEKHNIDILVASKPENVTYISEFQCLSQQNIYALLPRNRKLKSILIAPLAELDVTLEIEPWTEEIIPYGRFYFSVGNDISIKDEKLMELISKSKMEKAPFEILIKELEERAVDSGVIGVDDPNLASTLTSEMRKKSMKRKVKDLSTLLRKIRMKKTKEEIVRVKQSAKILQKAINCAMEQARKGITEMDLAKVFEKAIIDQGARISFTVIGFGARSAYPNAQPSKRKLRIGDIIRFDVGCTWKYYYGDIARSIVFGKPTDKQRRYYEAISKGEEKAIEAIKPGIRASEVFNIAINTIRGIIPHYKRHHCGHGIGLEVYEQPLISPSNDCELEEGMTLCIETPYYELGWGGLQVEDEILVTDDGIELLTYKDMSNYW